MLTANFSTGATETKENRMKVLATGKEIPGNLDSKSSENLVQNVKMFIAKQP